MHLIEGTPDFRLAEGPARDAGTGQRVPTPFKQGKLDPIHIRCVCFAWKGVGSDGGLYGCELTTTGPAYMQTKPKIDPNPRRRGHHLAFNVREMDSLLAELEKRGIPYGRSQVPGSNVQQAFFFDVEGNGIEMVYKPPPGSEEL